MIRVDNNWTRDSDLSIPLSEIFIDKKMENSMKKSVLEVDAVTAGGRKTQRFCVLYSAWKQFTQLREALAQSSGMK